MKLFIGCGDREPKSEYGGVVIGFWEGSMGPEELFKRFVLQHIRHPQDLPQCQMRYMQTHGTHLVNLDILLPLVF